MINKINISQQGILILQLYPIESFNILVYEHQHGHH